MEHQNDRSQKRPVRQRRKRSFLHIFIHTYLPLLVVLALLILFIIFVVNSLGRSSDKREQERQESLALQQSELLYQQELFSEANQLVAEAEQLAAVYDYDGAIAVLDQFSGNPADFDLLWTRREQYVAAKDALVVWNDPSKVPNLSFHLLIADADRAFKHAGYGDSFRWNFITTTEFSAILNSLYKDGYVLVNSDQLWSYSPNDGYTPNELHLPQGKKPLMITQTQVNYYTYMTDSDGDGLPDKDGGGFASKLIVDKRGKLTCEYVDAQGNTVTGAYDLVPILEEFIAQHPDFSYRGARATLAVSGYDGLFGYRTDPETAKKIGEEFYQQQLQELPVVAQALRDAGYTIACYTYENVAYGKLSANKIKEDLDKWKAEVTPLLGEIDTLVFAKNSDISDNTAAYDGDKYEVLYAMGFRNFLGFCDSSTPWALLEKEYVRQGRILVTGNGLENTTALYEEFFNPMAVKDPKR